MLPPFEYGRISSRSSVQLGASLNAACACIDSHSTSSMNLPGFSTPRPTFTDVTPGTLYNSVILRSLIAAANPFSSPSLTDISERSKSIFVHLCGLSTPSLAISLYSDYYLARVFALRPTGTIAHEFRYCSSHWCEPRTWPGNCARIRQ